MRTASTAPPVKTVNARTKDAANARRPRRPLVYDPELEVTECER